MIEPILERRDVVESKLFAAECVDAKDRYARIYIADYFDWLVPDFNAVVLADARQAVL